MEAGYSARKACMGSMEAARWAGITEAASASKRIVTAANTITVFGSLSILPQPLDVIDDAGLHGSLLRRQLQARLRPDGVEERRWNAVIGALDTCPAVPN